MITAVAERMRLLLLLWLGCAAGLEAGLGTWFVEHPQFAVALPGESVFFGCKTNSDAGDEAIRWLHDGKLIPRGDADFRWAEMMLAGRGELAGFNSGTGEQLSSQHPGNLPCSAAT